jgi:membrane protease YdiL (CAAX protease family)
MMQPRSSAPGDSGGSLRRLRSLSGCAADHPIVCFFAIAYIGSWTAVFSMLLLDGPSELMTVFGLSPLAAALITHRMATRNWRAFRLFGAWPRSLAALGLGTLLVTLAFVILPVLAVVDASKVNWVALTSVSLVFSTSPLAGPLLEEPAWRGYALPLLEAEFGALRRAVLLGFLWAAWHLPLFLLPGFSSAPFWMFALIVVTHSLLLTIATNLAYFAVLPAIVMHWVFNNSSAVLSGLLANVESSARVPFELAMGLCGLVVVLAGIVLTKGQLAYSSSRTTNPPASFLTPPESKRVTLPEK